MGISKYIAAAVLSASNIWTQASDTFQTQVIEQNNPQISKIRNEYSNQTEEVLKWNQVIGYSTDGGVHWQEIIGGLAVISAIIGIGGIFRFQKRRKWQIIETNESESDFLTSEQFAEIIWKNNLPDQWLKDTQEEWWMTIDALTEADLWMSIKDYDGAERYLLEWIKKNPENSELYIKLLELYHKTKNTPKFKDLFIILMDPQFDWKVSEKEMHQIKKWGKEIDSENSLYETLENHIDVFSIWTVVTAEIPKNLWESIPVLTNKLWDNLPILTEQIQKIGKTNEPIKIAEEEKLKIIERLRWIPMNPKMVDPGEFKKFEMKRINEAVMNQLIQRWFRIIEDEESWVVLVQPIKQSSSLYYLDKWNIGIVSTNESYIINPQTRNATMDYLDGIPCIKLTLPRGEVEYIQINGTRIPILHKK